MINDRLITISTGASRKSTNWKNQQLRLSELYDKLRTPLRGQETYQEYIALKKQRQDELKDVGGFVGGPLSGPRRKASAVAGRDIITLDFDNIPAGGTEDMLRRLEGLGCGYCVYSTRKHHPASPRLRVIIPLDRTVTADEYEPIARKLALYIGIEYADPTTFEPSRLMYWPSCCADSEYVYHYADKPMVSADGILAQYSDWRDISQWPQVPGAAPNMPRLAAKQGDPLEKAGIVGAFCRVYDIFAAMDKFLPGVYIPVEHDPNRFTYSGGSTTGGAIVYDGGKFLYSHHATDPCSGKLVNSFDLVRLHLFGEKDDDTSIKPDTPTNRLPSYTAMCELAAADPEISALLMQGRYAKTIEAFGEPQAGGEESNLDWMHQLERNGQGVPAKTLRNIKLILLNDPRLKGIARLNLFSGRIDVCRDTPWDRPPNNRQWSDTDTTELRIYLEPLIGKTSKADVADAVEACAGAQAYHPVRDYLNSLSWDGIPRLDTLLIDYLGAADTEYTRAVTRKAFTAAVARVMQPGIKYDTMLVLVGAQGRHKSTLLAKMGGEWFSDSLRTFEGKEAMETLQGTWINEVAEMQAMSRADVDAVKAFLTKTSDYYRAAYGRYAGDRPRQCVFFGTTNTKECLTDPTGGRRWWPVDIDAQARTKNVFRDLDAERDQIWAEAVYRWREKEPLQLSEELEEYARQVQEDHRARHPWEGIILDYLAQEVPEDWPRWDLAQRQIWRGGGAHGEFRLVPRWRICAAEIWCEALGRQKGDLTQRVAREINALLERVPGWHPVGVRDAGKPYGKQRCFEQTSATDLLKRATDLLKRATDSRQQKQQI